MMPESKIPEKAIVMLDTEERLLADADGSFRKGLAAVLDQLDAETQGHLRRPSAPDEHLRLRKLALGVEAARRVLDCCCRPARGMGGTP